MLACLMTVWRSVWLKHSEEKDGTKSSQRDRERSAGGMEK